MHVRPLGFHALCACFRCLFLFFSFRSSGLESFKSWWDSLEWDSREPRQLGEADREDPHMDAPRSESRLVLVRDIRSTSSSSLGFFAMGSSAQASSKAGSIIGGIAGASYGRIIGVSAGEE
mmetsp:Transcript_78885/g.207094  ORF Transcript_78885/g.207094 Transcript_78885/m.207094 type:complete len:121 (+) Transcript_78885:79-441(+)